jgi:hypothetical protein
MCLRSTDQDTTRDEYNSNKCNNNLVIINVKLKFCVSRLIPEICIISEIKIPLEVKTHSFLSVTVLFKEPHELDASGCGSRM